jgi:hypothetical protein
LTPQVPGRIRKKQGFEACSGYLRRRRIRPRLDLSTPQPHPAIEFGAALSRQTRSVPRQSITLEESQMDDRKVPPPTSEPPSEEKTVSRPEAPAQPKVEVLDREPLSIVVVDTPAAEPEVVPETQVEVPVRAPVRIEPTVAEPAAEPRIPRQYWLLVAAALGFLFLSYKNLYQPLMVHIQDSVERRILGEPSKIYDAPKSDPHTTQQKQHSKLKLW